MSSKTYQPQSSASLDPSPPPPKNSVLDRGWLPGSADLGVELPSLVPALDQVRGPVTRLLLSVGSWAARPHEIVVDGRTVSVGYLAGQSPSMMTVLCADGGTFTMRVTPAPEAVSGT